MRPWKIWSLYLICVWGVFVAMAWLTVRTLESERAELIARRQAEMEQATGRALWRMDSRLTPMLAEEAVRPSSVYRPFLSENVAPGTKAATQLQLSPLLVAPAEFVLLNFELSESDRLTSPQSVPAAQKKIACDAGVPEARLAEGEVRLDALRKKLNYSQLLLTCPVQVIPEVGDNFVAANTIQSQSDLAPAANFLQSVGEQVANSSLPSNSRALPPSAPNVDSANQQVNSQQTAINDLSNRAQSLQMNAQRGRRGQSFLQQDATTTPAIPIVREGVSRPIWFNGELLLARRVTIGNQTVIQGSWLDWPQIQQTLAAEVADLLPQVRFEPVLEPVAANPGRLLATLPVQLILPEIHVVPDSLSTIRVSLWTAWGAMFVTAVAIAVLLQGVMTLSERRGAFVSAVTHELRTPLTTFRMYAEMLAEGMIPDEARRQQYLHSLKTEADRLSHLVENVLQYARLERGRPGKRREPIRVAELLARQTPRLTERLQQAELDFELELPTELRSVTLLTDPPAVEQILFNLVDNACKYAANVTDRRVHLIVSQHGDQIAMTIRDHGPGITAQESKKLFRPFSKSVHEAANSAPGVGLGLALCHRLAKELNGSLHFVCNEAATTQHGASFELRLPIARETA